MTDVNDSNASTSSVPRSRRLGGGGAAFAAVALVAALSGCGGGDEEPLGQAPIKLEPSAAAASSTPSASPTVTAGGFAGRAGLAKGRVVDSSAELEMPDQSGDGRSVRVEEATVSRGTAHLAVFTSAGALLGSTTVTPSVSPASVRLTERVPASGELIAVLLADDGDGRLDLAQDRPITDGDGDGELEDDDFDYRLR